MKVRISIQVEGQAQHVIESELEGSWACLEEASHKLGQAVGRTLLERSVQQQVQCWQEADAHPPFAVGVPVKPRVGVPAK